MSKSTRSQRVKRGVQRTGLSSGAVAWVKNNVQDLASLPNPDETWTMRDVDLDGIRVDNLEEMGVIKGMGNKKTTSAGTHRRINTYRTTQVGYEAIVKYLKDIEENGTSGPCPNHSGIRNLGDGEYTCTNDECDRTWTRDEVDA